MTHQHTLTYKAGDKNDGYFSSVATGATHQPQPHAYHTPHGTYEESAFDQTFILCGLSSKSKVSGHPIIGNNPGYFVRGPTAFGYNVVGYGNSALTDFVL